MKLPQYQVSKHLSAKKLAPIYIVSGEEPFLKQEVSEQIRHAAKNAGYQEHIRLFIESAADWEVFYRTAYSFSLFSTQRLIEIESSETNVPAAAGKVLAKYAENLPKDTILLLRLNKLDKKVEKSAWLQALDKQGVLIPIWPLGRENLPQWIQQRAQQHQLVLTRDATLMLAENIEGNLLAASQVLEKLALLQVKNPIDPTIIASLLSDEAQFTIFDFAECLLTDKTRALRILTTLHTEGVEPTLLLWAVTRELRLLAALTRQRQANLALDKVYQEHRVLARRQPSLQRIAQQYTEKQCWERLMLAANIDRMIKGAMPGSPWESFEKMVVL